MYNQKGAIPLLLLISLIGIVAVLGVVSIAPFKNPLLSAIFPKQTSQAFTVGGWTMAGANPQRISWTPDEAPGMLREAWVRPIEPYIAQKVQVIGADTPSGKMVFVSTGKGLYAFDASDGAEKWVYATELPLGNSPTYDNGVLYVGGLDRNVYAINHDGSLKWKFSGAEGGFQTNPLIINNTVILGNRDGYIYALNVGDGSLKWKYKSGGQILQSAATSTDLQTIYFAAMDSHLYAVDANTGSQKWKSAKLPGQGFRSWWPVVYEDKVILKGGADVIEHNNQQKDWIYKPVDESLSVPGVKGSENGPWPVGQATMDIRTNPVGSPVPDYFETYPNRRMLFVFNQSNGAEVTFDIDNDGKNDSFIMSTDQENTSNYPVVVDQNNIIYSRTTNINRGGIPGGLPVGFTLTQPWLQTFPVSTSTGHSSHMAHDEPVGFSLGGNYMYWNLCCDRFIGGVDLSKSNTLSQFPSAMLNSTRQWRYVNGALPPMGISSMPSTQNGANADYFSQNLQYIISPDVIATKDVLYHMSHGDTVGPTIFDGKLFIVRSNALIAFAPIPAATKTVLPTAAIKSPQSNATLLMESTLQSKLEEQIQKLIAAGHLRSGHAKIGSYDFVLNQSYNTTFDEANIVDYWHDPAETLPILLKVLPHLSQNPTLQTQLRSYIQAEFNLFAPDRYRHIGFNNGTARESYDFITPPAGGPITGISENGLYALWLYTKEFCPTANTTCNPKTLFDGARTRFASPIATPSATMPNRINGRIAGLKGYLELKKLAGYTTPADQSDTDAKQAEYDQLLALRLGQLKWDLRYPKTTTNQNIINTHGFLISVWNFMHLSPDLSNALSQHNDPSAPDANNRTADSVIKKYERMIPHWFIGHNEEVHMENGVTPYQQTHTLFQAKAKVLKQSQEELVKYLDTPLYPVGDLYYIDNLVATLEAPTDPNSTPNPSVNSSPTASVLPSPSPAKPGDIDGNNRVDIFDYNLLLTNFGKNGSGLPGDIDNTGKVDIFDYNLLLTNFGK